MVVWWLAVGCVLVTAVVAFIAGNEWRVYRPRRVVEVELTGAQQDIVLFDWNEELGRQRLHSRPTEKGGDAA